MGSHCPTWTHAGQHHCGILPLAGQPAPTQQPLDTRTEMLRFHNQLGRDKPHPPDSTPPPPPWPTDAPGHGPTHHKAQDLAPHTCSAQALDHGHSEPCSQRPQTQRHPPASLLLALKPSSLSSGQTLAPGQYSCCCLQDPAHSPAGQHKLQDAWTPPVGSLKPATESMGPQTAPRTGSSCQQASTSSRTWGHHLVHGEQPWDYLDPDSPHL